MSSTDDLNARTIEFRSNHGKVGGMVEFAGADLSTWREEGAPLLLLHTIGARSGQRRINPLMYLKDGERYVVFASKAGADTNPDWYWNLKIHSDTQIEVGDDTIDVHAEEALGPNTTGSASAKSPSTPRSPITNARPLGSFP